MKKNLFVLVFLLAFAFVNHVRAQENMIYNHSFENGKVNWEHYVSIVRPPQSFWSIVEDEEAPDGNYVSSCLRFSPMLEYWYDQIAQEGFLLEAGKEYTISFWAKVDSLANSVWLTIMRDREPWDHLGLSARQFGPGLEWHFYEVSFIATETTTETRISFAYGKNEGTLFLDDIWLYKKSPTPTPTITPSPTPTPTDLPGNKIRNGSFEQNRNDLVEWEVEYHEPGSFECLVDTTEAWHGQNSAKMTVLEETEFVYSTQFYQNGIELESGSSYELSFYGGSDQDSRDILVIFQDMNNWEICGLEKEVWLNSEWQKKVLNFTPVFSEDANPRLSFCVGGQPGTVWLDYVWIEEAAEDCEKTKLQLVMPGHIFHSGESCYLDAEICSPCEVKSGRIFVALEAFGKYYFWPSWSNTPENAVRDIFTGYSTHEIIPPFTWPVADVGNAQGLSFLGLITSYDMEIMSNVSSWEFGWQ